MFAIVEIAGQQFKVSKDQRLYVHRLPQDEGAEVIFDKVLLLAGDGQVNVGAPAIQGAAVKAKILRHLKGDKVIVFKKKRRKGYDLKKIEGIGPKIAQILAEAGIDTFAKLAKANPDNIRNLLVEKGGKRYAMHNPDTWPKQAQLAADGKWDELKALQDQLTGGRE